MKHQFYLLCRLQPIRRVLREEDMIKNSPICWKERRNLRKKKRKLKAFELIQIDVKELMLWFPPGYWMITIDLSGWKTIQSLPMKKNQS